MLAGMFKEPALVHFVAQLVLVVISVQGVYQLFLRAVAPVHAVAVRVLGAQAASCASVILIVTSAHLIGAAMTVPALMDIKIGKIQQKKVTSLKRLLNDMPLVLVNYVISIVVGCAVVCLTTDDAVLQNIATDLPSCLAIARQTIFSLLMTELVFYHVHRAFHENKRLYALVHKVHHTWPAPVALVATYAHPVEHIFCNLLSVYIGPILCRAHPATTSAYTFLFAVGAYGHHSGYWSDDMGMHDLHHEAFNVNFGNAHILDYLYGTYRIKEGAPQVGSKS